MERGEIQALAISPDEKILATGVATHRRTDPKTGLLDPSDNRINLWDTKTGRHLGSLEGHQGYVRALVFSRNGRLLVSAGRDQTVRVWDVANRRLLKTLRGHEGVVTDVAVLADNSTLLSSATDGRILRWDLTTILAAESPPPVSALPGPFIRWRFAPQGQGVVTLDAAGEVVRWHGRSFGERDARLALGPIPTPKGVTAQRRDYTPNVVPAELDLGRIGLRQHPRELRIVLLDLAHRLIDLAANVGRFRE